MKPEANVGTFLNTYTSLSRNAPDQPAEDQRKAVLERLQQGDVAVGEWNALLPNVPEAQVRGVVDQLVQLRLVEIAGQFIRLSPHARKALAYLSVA
jgi:hypothetical protein